jgi:hypothetical protein
MKMYDSKGKLVSESTIITKPDGGQININTAYNTYTGEPVFQRVAIRDSQGKITTKDVIGGKVLP